MTPDGEFVAFMSTESLTGYNNNVASSVGKECSKNFGAACLEVFEFDAGTGRLVCASCNPTGERPLGYSSLSLIKPVSGVAQEPRNLASDGRLFFDSFDSLSPFDRNGGHEDVYEYEPVGSGSCTSTMMVPGDMGLMGEGGCVSMISGGQENQDSSFIGASMNGSDVFFVTRSKLVSEDGDELLDLYDAREPHVPGEEVGSESEPSPIQCESSVTCQGGPAPGPGSWGSPPSMTASGGNSTLVIKEQPKPKKIVLTRAQLLARALATCRKEHGKGSRARRTCEASARKRYGPKAKRKKGKKAGARNGHAGNSSKKGGRR